MPATQLIIPGTRLAQLLLVICSGLVVLFIASGGIQSVRLDTDLKSLSPVLSADRELQGAVNTLSSALENRLVLLVVADSDSATDTLTAATQLATTLSADDGVTVSVGNAVSDQLVDLFARHRFNLLSEDQRQRLASETDDELVKAATSRLFQFADSGRALPFERDPTGWFTDWLASIATDNAAAAPAQQEPAEVPESVTPVYVTLGERALDSDFQKTFGARLDAALADTADRFPEARVYRSGIFFFAEKAARTARSDITLISTVSTVGVIVLMLLAFRSIRPMLLALVSIGFGIGCAFLGSHFLYGKVHILTLVFGAGLIGIVIDYALHFSYHRTWAGDRLVSPARSARSLFAAMALSLGSSLIGYAALGLSSLAALERVAVFSCLGLAASWGCVIALGPFLGRGRPQHHSAVIGTATRWVDTAARHLARWPAALATLVALGLLALLLSGVKENDDPRALFRPDPDLVVQEREVAMRTGALQPGQYFIVQADSTDQLYERIALLDDAADGLLSIASLLPSPANQRASYLAQGRLYRSDGVVGKLLNALGAEQDIAATLEREYRSRDNEIITPAEFIAASGNQLPPLVIERDGRVFGFVLVRSVDHPEPALQVAAQNSGILFIDTARMSSVALGEQRRSALSLLLIGFGLVGALLLLRYRRLAALGLLLVPMSSIIAALVCFTLLGIGVTLFHTMALFLVLGLGMDYVIFSAEMRDHPDVTRQAVFLSALTSLLSFGLLAWSSMPVVHAFGLTMLIGNLFNLLGALIYGNLIARYAALEVTG